MPRIVDHDARRHHIADALHRLVARDGMEAVSLREVAAEAGVSMGMVQHYFASKDDMLMLALERLNARVGRRVAAAAGEGGPRDLLRAGLLELLPLDDGRRAEATVGLAYLARAATAPDLAALLRAALPYVVEFYAGQIRAAQAAGQVAAGLDAGKEATVLFAFAQGLISPALIGHYTPEEVVAAVDYQLDRLFAG